MAIERREGARPIAALNDGRPIVGGSDSDAAGLLERRYRREARRRLKEVAGREAARLVMLKNFRLRRSIDKIDLNVRLSANKNALRDIEQRFGYALSSGEAEGAKADLLGIVKLAAEHLHRAEEGHAEVLAEVEALRAELEQFRTTIGSAIGVTLER